MLESGDRMLLSFGEAAGEVNGEPPAFPCRASRAASWRRARDGGILRGGGRDPTASED